MAGSSSNPHFLYEKVFSRRKHKQSSQDTSAPSKKKQNCAHHRDAAASRDSAVISSDYGIEKLCNVKEDTERLGSAQVLEPQELDASSSDHRSPGENGKEGSRKDGETRELCVPGFQKNQALGFCGLSTFVPVFDSSDVSDSDSQGNLQNSKQLASSQRSDLLAIAEERLYQAPDTVQVSGEVREILSAEDGNWELDKVQNLGERNLQVVLVKNPNVEEELETQVPQRSIVLVQLMGSADLNFETHLVPQRQFRTVSSVENGDQTLETHVPGQSNLVQRVEDESYQELETDVSGTFNPTGNVENAESHQVPEESQLATNGESAEGTGSHSHTVLETRDSKLLQYRPPISAPDLEGPIDIKEELDHDSTMEVFEKQLFVQAVEAQHHLPMHSQDEDLSENSLPFQSPNFVLPVVNESQDFSFVKFPALDSELEAEAFGRREHRDEHDLVGECQDTQQRTQNFSAAHNLVVNIADFQEQGLPDLSALAANLGASKLRLASICHNLASTIMRKSGWQSFNCESVTVDKRNVYYQEVLKSLESRVRRILAENSTTLSAEHMHLGLESTRSPTASVLVSLRNSESNSTMMSADCSSSARNSTAAEGELVQQLRSNLQASRSEVEALRKTLDATKEVAVFEIIELKTENLAAVAEVNNLRSEKADDQEAFGEIEQALEVIQGHIIAAESADKPTAMSSAAPSAKLDGNLPSTQINQGSGYEFEPLVTAELLEAGTAEKQNSGQGHQVLPVLVVGGTEILEAAEISKDRTASESVAETEQAQLGQSANAELEAAAAVDSTEENLKNLVKLMLDFVTGISQQFLPGPRDDSRGILEFEDTRSWQLMKELQGILQHLDMFGSDTENCATTLCQTFFDKLCLAFLGLQPQPTATEY